MSCQLHRERRLFVHQGDRRRHRRVRGGRGELSTLHMLRHRMIRSSRWQRTQVDIAVPAVEVGDDTRRRGRGYRRRADVVLRRRGAERRVQIDLDERALGAVRVGERPNAGDILPVDGRTRRGRKIDALDAEIAELGQFSGFADALLPFWRRERSIDVHRIPLLSFGQRQFL